MFFKKTKRKIEQLTQEISDLKNLIKSKEYERLKQDSAEYKESLNLLRKIRIELDRVEVIDNNDLYATKSVRIKYKIPNIVINFDDEKNPIKNEMFYALNYLELIKLDDTKKIMGLFEKIKKGG